MVTNPSRNSTEGRSLGAVIINLQRTPLDGAATLRVFGECDAVLAQLLAALGLPPAAVPPRRSWAGSAGRWCRMTRRGGGWPAPGRG